MEIKVIRPDGIHFYAPRDGDRVADDVTAFLTWADIDALVREKARYEADKIKNREKRRR